MPKYVRIANNEVVECLDYLPERPGVWMEAVEIEPTLVAGRQIRGSHTFDISKNPVEINWSVIDLTPADRKEMLVFALQQRSRVIIQQELLKEFEGTQSDLNFVQTKILEYRAGKAAIDALVTHEDIEAFIAANG